MTDAGAGEQSLPSLSVVIPTYRAGGTLRHVVEIVIEELSGSVSDLEIIIVDDDSPDHCWPEIVELGRADTRTARCSAPPELRATQRRYWPVCAAATDVLSASPGPLIDLRNLSSSNHSHVVN